jgi:phage shock protein PspC (stress-responsive transcriptional regulator)
MEHKLDRSRTGQMLGGVCSGLAGYFDLDVTLIRLIFVLLAFAQGTGVLIYVALWLILPPEGQMEETTWQENIRLGTEEMRMRAEGLSDGISRTVGRGNQNTVVALGAAFVLLGLLFIARNFVPWLRMSTLWPVLLIVLGVIMLTRR